MWVKVSVLFGSNQCCAFLCCGAHRLGHCGAGCLCSRCDNTSKFVEVIFLRRGQRVFCLSINVIGATEGGCGGQQEDVRFACLTSASTKQARDMSSSCGNTSRTSACSSSPLNTSSACSTNNSSDILAALTKNEIKLLLVYPISIPTRNYKVSQEKIDLH